MTSRASVGALCTHHAILRARKLVLTSAYSLHESRVMPLIGRRHRIESVFTTRGPGAATRGPCSSPATAREEPRTSGEFEDGFNPWEILRISRGTSFLGMVNARKLAEEKHAKDPVQLALIARAFDFFISASRERFENMVQNNPTSADAHFQIGNFYHTIQMYTRAETSYRDCLRLDANHADALNNLAMLLGQLDRDDEAEKVFRNADAIALKNGGEDVDLLFNWAALRLQHGDLDGTRELVTRIVKAQPELADHPLVRELEC